MTALYNDGTITLENGSPLITGNDTAWAISLIVGGTVFVEVDGGNPLPILPDDSGTANLHPITDTQMTSAINWTGPSGTFNYALVRDMSYTRQQALNAEKLGDLLSQLDNPLMAALSSIEGLQDHLILLTGPSTATIIPRSSLTEGVDYDVAVNTLADRAAYNAQAKDFSVLVANAGNGRAAVFVKRSNTSGDWVDPVYITGPGGATGQPGPYTTIQMGQTTTLNPGQAATATLTPVSAGVVRLDLGLPKGVDGTGTGDVVGPNSGVTAKQIAGFASNTGKAIAGLTPSEVRVAADAGILSSFRNKLINGGMTVRQRGAVTISAGGVAYTLDKWLVANTTNQPCTVDFVDFAPGATGIIPGAPKKALSIYFATAPTSGTVNILQRVEGIETLAGKAVTLRVYAAAPASTAITADLTQYFGTGGSPSANVQYAPAATSAVGLSTAYTKIDALFNLNELTGKTRGTNNDDYLQTRWVITPRATGLYLLARAGLVEGDCRAEIDVFSERHPQQEFALCQRYFERRGIYISLNGLAGVENVIDIPFVAQKRATPTIALPTINYSNGQGLRSSSPDAARFLVAWSAVSAGQTVINAQWTADAEL